MVVIPAGAQTEAADALAGIANVTFVTGGPTRQSSVANGLAALGEAKFVLIHDAARPVVTAEVVERLLGALADADGAIPALPLVDSIAVADGTRMASQADRDNLKRVQTPQAFRYDAILAAHEAWQGEPTAGDDAQVLKANGGMVTLVPGDESMAKVTFAEDFVNASPFRVGTGHDVHRLADGEELWLCGVKIEHDRGLAGHSDADVGLHAVVDAILGAAALGDIGQHFPPSDARWKGASSGQFVEHAVKLADEAGYAVGNVDLTIVCEAPKIGPHRDAMRERLAGLLAVDVSRVSVKATTTERLGFTGRGEGIEARAVALLQAKD